MSAPLPRSDFRDRLIMPAPAEAGPPALTLALTGASGDGKTRAALSFPGPLVLHADANDGQLKASGVPYITVGGADYPSFVREVLPAIDRRDPWFETFDTIILDSASFFQMDARAEIDFEDEKRSRGAYGQLKRDTMEPIRKLVKLGVAPRPGVKVWNVVITCHRSLHLKEVKSQGGQIKSQTPDGYKPLLEGASRDLFDAYFNTVIALRTAKVSGGFDPATKQPRPATMRYLAQTERDSEYFAKDSIGGDRYKKLPTDFDWTDKPFYETLTGLWGM